MKYSLVLTTINVPELLKGYAKNFLEYGHETEVEILVVGDVKTPHEKVENLIVEINKLGILAEYFDVDKQEQWLTAFPELKKIIPYNSDNRRNVGYLIAAQRGAEIIIAVDDDNYVDSGTDYLAAHAMVGQTREFEAISDESKWFNICSMIKFNPERKVYPRGYPYAKRFKDGNAASHKRNGRIMINEGLWLEDPDIDSITRLTEDVKGVEILKEGLVLDKGIFSPINTQNTAFHRDILPCLYFVLMGGIIDGLVIERYGDIWFGFFAKRIIDHMGGYVSFGHPFAIHRRNQHDLLKDLKQEFWAITFTELLAEFIEHVTLTATTYGECYIELAEKLEKFISDNKQINDQAKQYFREVAAAMIIWANTCKLITVQK